VEHELNGLLFPVRSPEGLAAAVRHWLALGPQGRALMGAAARRTAESRFSEQQVVAAYLRELGNLVAGTRA
jgi:glycosyltransferase involved in cell wall biosynthesis